MINWPENVSILIPSYKSAHLIKKFIPELLKIVPSKNICVVDDASNDNTDQICDSFGITCLKHTVNKGKGAALDTGFRYLINQDFSWLITMDDGQHAPRDWRYAYQEQPGNGYGIGTVYETGCNAVSKFVPMCHIKTALDSPDQILTASVVTECILLILLNLLIFSCGLRSLNVLSGSPSLFPSVLQCATLYLDGSVIFLILRSIRWVKAYLLSGIHGKQS